MDEPYTVALEIQVTPEVKRSIEKAAHWMGVPVDMYITAIHITNLIAQSRKPGASHGR